MSKQFGVSSLLAAAASMLVVGMVALGTPAQAASEEDLAAPRGAFVSTMAVPNDPANIVTRTGDRPAPIVTASEEDAAVPHGSFTSTMIAPEIRGNKVRLASASDRENALMRPDNGNEISLPEIVAAGLE
jgi:hypothetical protein